jgi:hypothetical protein
VSLHEVWPDMTTLHRRLADGLAHAHADELDLVTSVDVHKTNVMMEAESADLSFNLKHLWLTRARWTKMLNDYVDAGELRVWLDKCETIGKRGRGMAVMRMKEVNARAGPKVTRRWGGCMLAASYRAVPRPTITLHSRTSYVGYLGILDLGVASCLARYGAAAAGLSAPELRFTWMLEDAQWHNFKSLAWLLCYPYSDNRRAMYHRLLTSPEEKLTGPERATLRNRPALRLSRNWMYRLLKEDQAGVPYGDMTYNTYRRIRRRFHTEILGYDIAKLYEGGRDSRQDKAYKPLPQLFVEDLDFGPIGVTL